MRTRAKGEDAENLEGGEKDTTGYPSRNCVGKKPAGQDTLYSYKCKKVIQKGGAVLGRGRKKKGSPFYGNERESLSEASGGKP